MKRKKKDTRADDANVVKDYLEGKMQGKKTKKKVSRFITKCSVNAQKKRSSDGEIKIKKRLAFILTQCSVTKEKR